MVWLIILKFNIDKLRNTKKRYIKTMLIARRVNKIVN